MCDRGFGGSAPTLFFVLCVTPFFQLLRQFGSVEPFSEGLTLRDFYSNSRLRSKSGYGLDAFSAFTIGLPRWLQRRNQFVRTTAAIQASYRGIVPAGSVVNGVCLYFSTRFFSCQDKHRNPWITVYPFIINSRVNRYPWNRPAARSNRLCPCRGTGGLHPPDRAGGG